jgi:hypothetical protein
MIALDQEVGRGPNVVVSVPTLRAFTSGCMIDVEAVIRRAGVTMDLWWDMRTVVHLVVRSDSGAGLSDRVMRLGVRFADGTKATTLDPVPGRDSPPAGPLLSWSPRSSGGGRHGGEEYSFDNFGLWLWPLPPAEPFEFAVEWPLGGVELTITELDGAAIVSTAARSRSYWL